ncbi:MAG: diadenylate cyclase [Candidatus Omnitrophica bacterium]|nr:diadenylate cyclase [Candidatus Omnitrophota bacterium]
MKSLFFNWILEIGWNGLLDIVLMAILIYFLLIWFNKTRAAFILKGIFITLFVYLIARIFNLVMISMVFEKFFGVIFIAFVVIFQEEIRRFFERIAAWGINRRFGIKLDKKYILPQTDVLVRTLFELARKRIGALVVIKGKDVIGRQLDGGHVLNGVISSQLIASLFDPHSAGHDGAMIIEGNKITLFSCHLPLSKNLKALKNHGTRHAAGLGLAELSDALCLIVSEEKGTISVAHEGSLREVRDPDHLTAIVDDFYQMNQPKPLEAFWQNLFKKTSREKFYALIIAIGLWFVLVFGAETTYKSFTIPVQNPNLPGAWIVQKLEPNELRITLRGTRRALYLMKVQNIKVNLDLKLTNMEQNIKLHADNLRIPEDIDLESIEPTNLNVTLSHPESP